MSTKQSLVNEGVALFTEPKPKKKPRTVNVVATHYVVTWKGEVKVYDVINAPARNSTQYKRRERGLVEGAWINLRSAELVPTLKQAKDKAIKDMKKSIKYDKEQLKKDEKCLKVMQKIKVK